VSDESLSAHLDDWLAPLIGTVRRLSQLDRIDFVAALSNLLDWKQRRALDELAPSHIEVPTGSRIAVDYADPAAPSLAVRIQELFGLADSPRVLGGRVPVTLQLLSPAHRPVQVTRDLAGFWRTSYFDVRKDLRGRYPKHEWPEDPMNATPTRRAKPRGR
jgi:ATP-dependent helicase HrpB